MNEAGKADCQPPAAPQGAARSRARAGFVVIAPHFLAHFHLCCRTTIIRTIFPSCRRPRPRSRRRRSAKWVAEKVLSRRASATGSCGAAASTF